MKDVFAFIGMGFIALVIWLTACGIFDEIKNLIKRVKWKHKYKHRFDKSPTAKCYCKDCWYWSQYNGKCCAFGGFETKDNWFCWMATPTYYDREKEK